ncbi:MAG: hypothetical protein IJX85_03450 [Lachnospiraceae bacterium]|nr:hypothetical protein [Lachnospiraceae bacterium]
MSPTVIILIVIGIIFIFVSYFFAESFEKEEPKDDVIEVPTELTEEQKAQIDKLIKDYMDERIGIQLDDIEGKFSEIVNQKTLALGDYAVTVNEEIEKNHNEVTFLYSMLSDKQKELMTTVEMIDSYKKEIEAMIANKQIVAQTKQEAEEQELKEAISEIDEELSQETTEVEASVDGSKDIILEMHKSGLSILEIAKHLGLGVGEVKLVVDLYQGDAK